MSPTVPHVRLAIEPNLESVSLLASALRGVAADHFGEELVHRAELAVVEACTNIIRHGLKGTPDAAPVEMQVVVGPAALEVQLIDNGPPFDWPAKAFRAFDPADPGTIPVGGYGLPLIHASADGVHGSRAGGRNRLCLTFRPR